MAAIPNNVVRCSMVWSPGTEWPAEQAVNTIHLQQQTGPSGSVPDVQYIADQVAAKIIAGFGGIAAFWSNNAQMTAVKTYLLDTTGHTTAEGQHTFSPGDVAGSGSTNMLPPEVALVLGLYSYPPGGFAPQKGRKRGRIYLPYLTSSNLTSDGKVTGANCQSIANGWASIFNAINTIESASGRTDPMGLVVLSRAAGATFEVGYTVVDDHWDAQRRRQHQDTPVRHQAVVTAW